VLVADPARAKALLRWTPGLSDLDTIVATAMKPRLAGFAGLGSE
jgi:UDP-glucose 4-epimerase